MNDGYAPSGDDWIFYRENGSGEQAVVFIHAGVTDSRMWTKQLEMVPDGFRFVAYDRRGYGNTEVGKQEHRDFQDALAVMDNLSIERAVVVGCSNGGGTALDMAISAPDRVSGLVLVGADSPGFRSETDFESPQWSGVVEAFDNGDYEGAARLEAEIWLVGHGRDPGYEPDAGLVDLFVEMDLKAMANEEERDRQAGEGPDRATGVGALDVPTLVMVGRYDIPPLHDHARDLAAKLAGGDMVVIEGAAHIAPLERPDVFNVHLFTFLGTL